MLQLTQAARSLGITDAVLSDRVEHGTVPEAVLRSGDWFIPMASLGHIAEREGWHLDLTANHEPSGATASTGRYATDALAAQAAVLVAKTQATAARIENQSLFRRLRQANTTAAADRAARQETADALAEAEAALSELRRTQAVAEAKLDELRNQLDHDDRQFQFMVDRISTLETERQRLHQSLGWFGRLKYRRLLQQGWGAGSGGYDLDPPETPSTTSQVGYPPPQPAPPVKADGSDSTALATVRTVEALTG